jgi:hypothetical protein
MSSTSETTPWGAYKAWSRSLPVQIAMIPIVVFSGFRVTHSGPAALAFGVAAVVSLMIRLRLRDARRRRREAREHIAGLSRY